MAKMATGPFMFNYLPSCFPTYFLNGRFVPNVDTSIECEVLVQPPGSLHGDCGRVPEPAD